MVYWYSYPAEFPTILFDNSMVSEGYTYILSNIYYLSPLVWGKERKVMVGEPSR